MRYLESNSTDPRWNLAVEQYIFDAMDKKENYFFLWQNDHTIVVGKNQNAVEEINNDFVRRQGITVVRRLSGGGAVYHDLGNLNFTFVATAGDMEHINFQMFCQPVLETLRSFGVEAMISGRNDITVDGKKFSGNSQYIRDHRVMHHGTILFNSDLAMVGNALRVDQAKMESKGVKSVVSRVTNLSNYLPADVTLQDFKNRLLSCLGQELTPMELTQVDREQIAAIKKERYDSWEWNYGYSPAYTTNRRCRLEGCGQIEISLSVENGILQDIQFFGDFFENRDAGELARQLQGCPCRREEVEERAADCGRYIQNLKPKQLAELIAP
ncbi:MAG: lipoate--protein ligase [Clostridiales bacterium]|nr:lipoate--protein ligase [Clostridiales bacterium]